MKTKFKKWENKEIMSFSNYFVSNKPPSESSRISIRDKISPLKKFSTAQQTTTFKFEVTVQKESENNVNFNLSSNWLISLKMILRRRTGVRCQQSKQNQILKTLKRQINKRIKNRERKDLILSRSRSTELQYRICTRKGGIIKF